MVPSLRVFKMILDLDLSDRAVLLTQELDLSQQGAWILSSGIFPRIQSTQEQKNKVMVPSLQAHGSKFAHVQNDSRSRSADRAVVLMQELDLSQFSKTLSRSI